jgi:hypothetical protein
MERLLFERFQQNLSEPSDDVVRWSSRPEGDISTVVLDGDAQDWKAKGGAGYYDCNEFVSRWKVVENFGESSELGCHVGVDCW